MSDKLAFVVWFCLCCFASGHNYDWWLKRIDSKVDNILDKLNEGNDLKHLHEVAFGKNALQSSTYNQLHATLALDGETNTSQHTQQEQGPFLMIDLGKNYKIKRIDVFNRKRCCGERLHDLDITFGTSNNRMSLCAHYKGPSFTGSHLVFYCKRTQFARYVKLIIKGKEYLHVAEVKVYAIDN